MGWNPLPSTPKIVWKGLEVSLVTQTWDAGDEIILVYRPVGALEWSSMGASDGSVWLGDFSSEVTTMGFIGWVEKIIGLINARLAEFCAKAFPTTQVDVPTTFAEFQTWLPSNLSFKATDINILLTKK